MSEASMVPGEDPVADTTAPPAPIVEPVADPAVVPADPAPSPESVETDAELTELPKGFVNVEFSRPVFFWVGSVEQSYAAGKQCIPEAHRDLILQTHLADAIVG